MADAPDKSNLSVSALTHTLRTGTEPIWHAVRAGLRENGYDPDRVALAGFHEDEDIGSDGGLIVLPDDRYVSYWYEDGQVLHWRYASDTSAYFQNSLGVEAARELLGINPSEEVPLGTRFNPAAVLEAALQLAGEARSSYEMTSEDARRLSPRVDPFRGSELQLIDETTTDTQILVRHVDQGHTLIVFRGTEARLVDLMIDLRTSGAKRFRIPGRWHRGFLDAAYAALPFVAREIKNSRSAILAGHSLGGAVACVTAGLLADSAGAKIQCVLTFGAPRCATPAAARWLEAKLHPISIAAQTRRFKAFIPFSPWRLIRIVDPRDPVPNLPPALLGFRHAGRAVYLGDDGAVSERNDWRRAIWKSVSKHFMVHYERSVSIALARSRGEDA